MPANVLSLSGEKTWTSSDMHSGRLHQAWTRIRISGTSRRVQFGSPVNGGLAPDPKPNGYGSDFEIRGVERLNQPFDVDLIVRDDFVDMCIHQERTIISKRPDRPQGDRIFLFVDRGEVTFEDIVIRPLA
jgi:hypothetical protein